MSRNIFYAALASIVLTLAAGAEEREMRAFTRIDYPGSAVTGAFGANAQRAIVGFYVDRNGTHGFLLRDGKFSPINYPGAMINYTAGTSLKIGVLPPSGCRAWPASVNAVVQYQGG